MSKNPFARLDWADIARECGKGRAFLMPCLPARRFKWLLEAAARENGLMIEADTQGVWASMG
jgi:hypothetical protein